MFKRIREYNVVTLKVMNCQSLDKMSHLFLLKANEETVHALTIIFQPSGYRHSPGQLEDYTYGIFV